MKELGFGYAKAGSQDGNWLAFMRATFTLRESLAV
jgi:hypothetical protein